MVLVKPQQVHIKEAIPLCKHKDKDKDQDESCISLEDLHAYPTLAQQRTHLGDKLARAVFAKRQSASPNDATVNECRSAEACGYTLSKPLKLSADKSHVHASMHKMLTDDVNKKKCCMGAISSHSCASHNYVPLDPKGKCTYLVPTKCQGTANTCGRHKFLSNASSKTNLEDWFCGFWYMGNVDAYIPSSRHSKPCKDGGSSCKRTKQHATAYVLIHDYCGKRPETGECACIQAHDLCNCRTSGKDCGIYGDFRQHYGRRYELYKWTRDQTNSKYSYKPLTPGSPTFGTTPVHCWSVACQYANRCGFFPEKTFERKCPNICMQYSGNTTVNLKNITGYKELAVNGFMMRCPGGGGSSSNKPKDEPKIGTPLQLSTFQAVDSIAPNTWVEEKRVTLKLTNKAKDNKKPKQATRYFCISSSSPKIAFARPRHGCLKSGESTDVALYVTTAGLTQGQYYVSILVQDICDGGDPFEMIYSVHPIADPPDNIPPHACTHNC